MSISTFDIFSIGIGPSSSHTVGPMRAAVLFLNHLKKFSKPESISSIRIELFGSLALTGKGHGSDKAILLGLMGYLPETVETEKIPELLEEIRQNKQVEINDHCSIMFDEHTDLLYLRTQTLPLHSNGMRFTAFNRNDEEIIQKIYYSVGGGFVVGDDKAEEDSFIDDEEIKVKYPFSSADELLAICKENGISISTLMLENEKSWRKEEIIKEKLDEIYDCMERCISRGIKTEGILPGGLKVKRRASGLYKRLITQKNKNTDPMIIMDWVNLFALAVNEENAGGGQIVTAPTNGAAGIIPAVLKYFTETHHDFEKDHIHRYLLTAAAIGILYKINASISGAEVGCQGEVGVACSMAAGALTEILGGTPEQVENAAEIGMEHNLGLTCDPVGGLVQVPCIERNAMGAIKAINASRLALQGDGSHKVSLDKVIKTMKETGEDMQSKYKETARGGLAVNIIEC